jgi:UDP-N-acetylmuramyl pentapeptide phosphotransferase/UDP-N-acetylglucosamine-1-phosphate transferase
MDRALTAAVLFAATASLSAFFVWQAAALGRRLGITDRQSNRGVNLRPVPRTGGIAVMIAVLAGLALSFSFDIDRFPSEIERLALLCAGGAIVATLMLVDDVLELSPGVKLLIQLGVACPIVLPRLRGPFHGISIDQFNLPIAGQVSVPLAIAIPLTLLWFVGMMNTLNWADGIDGMAASISLVASAVLFLHTYFWPRGDPQYTISILALVLGAALVGFLPFNWHPSRVMLGDSGSNFLGLMLAGLSIIGGAKLATALLVLGLPLLDVAFVIVRRWLDRRPLTSGDATHLHHRLLERGWSQAKIVIVVSSLSLAFGLLALLLPNREAKLMAMAVLAGLMVLTIGHARSREPRSDTSSRR